MRTIKAALIGVIGVAVLAGAAVAEPKASDYHIITKWQIGGDGSWDYLNIDPASHHLFISRSTRVDVVDTETGKVVGSIADTQGVHGIALAPELGFGYTSNGGDASSTQFDVKTLKEIKRVKTDAGPDSIIYDPYSKRVFTFNGRANDATAIDAATGTAIQNIPLDGRPEFGGTDGEGHVYVNIEDKSEVSEIDSKTLKVIKTWSIAPGDGPSGLAIDGKHHRTFSVCGNKIMVVSDTVTGKVVATPAIGEGPDAAGFDPETQFAFSSNGRAGTLTIIHEKDPNSFKVVADVPTENGARTMALDKKTHRVYLATAKFGPPDPNATGWGRRRGKILPGSFTIIVVGP